MDREKEIENLKLAIAESSKETKVYVGCDSKRYADGRIKYATNKYDILKKIDSIINNKY